MTSTLPAGAGAEVAEIWVGEMTVKLEAAVEPKLTALAPVKPVPLMLTGVPPAGGPATGLTVATDGTAS